MNILFGIRVFFTCVVVEVKDKLKVKVYLKIQKEEGTNGSKKAPSVDDCLQ